jgi:hypothetical protein
MTIFAAVLILVVTRNIKDPRRKQKAGLFLIGMSLLLFAFPLYAEVLGAIFFEQFGTVARIIAAVFLPYGLYNLAPAGYEPPISETAAAGE